MATRRKKRSQHNFGYSVIAIIALLLLASAFSDTDAPDTSGEALLMMTGGAGSSNSAQAAKYIPTTLKP